MGNKKERCFIITPIGDETDPIRRHVEGIIDAAIIPAIGDTYEIVVAHKISEPGSITKQVITEIYNSKLVIANLTNRNPNVMYELALRHAIGKPAIMIAEKGTNLPSDIIMQRTIFYQNDAKGVLDLRDELVKTEHDISYSSKCGPIFDVLGDISNDTNLLQKVEKTDSESMQPLEYIISRLNRIEDAIMTSKRYKKSEVWERAFIYNFFFRFEEQRNEFNSESLVRRLSVALRAVDPEIRIIDVAVNTEGKSISIYLEMKNTADTTAVNRCCKKILSEFGFIGARSINIA